MAWDKPFMSMIDETTHEAIAAIMEPTFIWEKHRRTYEKNMACSYGSCDTVVHCSNQLCRTRTKEK